MAVRVACIVAVASFSAWIALEAPVVKASIYQEALQKSIVFFEGQRSGRLPSDQRQNWRGDSGLQDGQLANVDLVGGYYDAGDNVKFGFPFAFTITMLSWSVIEFGSQLLESGEMQHVQEAIRWGTDYMLKAHTAADELYMQVGDPHRDHSCWERPEDMDTERTPYKVDSEHPGSDVAAETAAALAAASMVFQDGDPDYASNLLVSAQQLFAFADSYRGSYSDQYKLAVCPFYCSFSGYEDELMWASAWLYRATNNRTHVQYLLDHEGELGGTEDSSSVFWWDDKYRGAQVLLSILQLQTSDDSFTPYTTQAQKFLCSLIPDTGFTAANFSPGGLLYQEAEYNMQYVTSTAFLLTAYQKQLQESGVERVACSDAAFYITPGQMLQVVKQQVDYILGQNPRGMSYMVGFGSNYPQRVHHRASSMPSLQVHPERLGCLDGFNLYYGLEDPNPNVLDGAVVGGPDENDDFNDQRTNFNQLEPAIYINAPLVGVLGYLAAA